MTDKSWTRRLPLWIWVLPAKDMIGEMLVSSGLAKSFQSTPPVMAWRHQPAANMSTLDTQHWQIGGGKYSIGTQTFKLCSTSPHHGTIIPWSSLIHWKYGSWKAAIVCHQVLLQYRVKKSIQQVQQPQSKLLQIRSSGKSITKDIVNWHLQSDLNA